MATTRELILASAEQRFAVGGYAGTSVRDIAAGAGIDAALIIRHFGSKEELFLQAMRLHTHHTPALDGPIETLGRELIESMLAPDDHVKAVFLALLRAGDSNGVTIRLREAHDDFFVAPLRARLAGPDADLRARLAASMIGGLLYSLWAVGDEALAATAHAEIVATYAPLLQQLITPAP